MKIVGTFTKPEEAQLFRAHLEGSGITAYVRDEQTVSVDWALSNAIGGVKVEVADEDYEAVVALMKSLPPDLVAKMEDEPTKPARCFGRYIRIFTCLFIPLFAFFAWRWDAFAGSGMEMCLVTSTALSLFVAGSMWVMEQ